MKSVKGDVSVATRPGREPMVVKIGREEIVDEPPKRKKRGSSVWKDVGYGWLKKRVAEKGLKTTEVKPLAEKSKGGNVRERQVPFFHGREEAVTTGGGGGLHTKKNGGLTEPTRETVLQTGGEKSRAGGGNLVLKQSQWGRLKRGIRSHARREPDFIRAQKELFQKGLFCTVPGTNRGKGESQTKKTFARGGQGGAKIGEGTKGGQKAGGDKIVMPGSPGTKFQERKRGEQNKGGGRKKRVQLRLPQ